MSKMSSEKRLIDANAFKVFLEGVRQDYIEENTFSSDFAANVIETVQDNYLELAPTVDAVEVVRCKDCLSYQETIGKDSGKPCGYGSCYNPCAIITGIVYDEDFCSYGERKNDA